MEQDNYDFVKILSQKDSLNLEIAQRRLILIALIRTDFNIQKAYEINCKDSFYSLDNYNKMWRVHFPCGIKELRRQFKEGFEVEKGKVIKKKK